MAFINYGDYHLPLSEMDIINIEAIRALPIYKHRTSHGEGMSDVLKDEALEHIINKTTSDGDYNEAPFKIDTILMADEGKTINGDDLNAIIQEAKAKKVPIASLVRKIPNASVRIIVSPGPGVVEQAPRSGGRKNRQRR